MTMSKLDDLIKKLCPNGVEFHSVEDVANVARGVRVVRSQLADQGSYPVFQNSLTPMGYYEKQNCKADTAFVIAAGAAGEIGYSYSDFWAADDCYFFKCSKALSSRYLYHMLLWKQPFLKSRVRKASIPRLSRDHIEQLSIPVPPLPVQEEIVRILDSFTKLEAELEAELEARRRQYEYYRDKLLNFNELDKAKSGGVKLMALGEIADIGTGSSNTNEELIQGLYPFFVRSQEVRWKNSYEFDETAIITSGDGVGVGKVFHFVEGKYALHQRAYRIHITDDAVFPKYFFHYMKTNFLAHITKNAVHSSVTSIRRPMLEKFIVPVPSMEKQKRIVSILDRFDTLVNDLTSGLPAEIKARRQQYEYYRDKLLTFSPLQG